jgi:hypothetical protein
MTDSKNTVVRYVRHPFTGEPIACVVAVNTSDGIKVGWSQCNKLDTFCKRTGRAIAVQRAMFPPTEVIRPALVKFTVFHPYTGLVAQQWKADLIGDAIRDVRKFAEEVAFAVEPKRPTAEELPDGLYFSEDGKSIVDIDGKLVARIVEYEPSCGDCGGEGIAIEFGEDGVKVTPIND